MPEGRLSHWGFGKEVAFGTPVAATRYAQFISESLYSKIGEVTPANIVGVFDEGPTFLGLKEHTGKISTNVYPDFIGMLFMAGWGADTLVAAESAPGASPSSSGGSLASATYYVKTAPIFGGSVTPASGTFVGVAGEASAEANAVVTGPTGSVTVTPVAVTGAIGFIIWYGTATGAENLAIVTTGATGVITSTTVGGAVVSSTPKAGSNLHVFNPRQANWGTGSIVQPLTMEIHRDLGQAFQFSGTAIEKMMLKFGIGSKGADAVLTGEIDVIAKDLQFISATTPVFDSQSPFLWNQAAISLAGAPYVTIQDLQIDIDNGIEGKPYIDGTNEIHSIVAKSPRIVGVSGVMLADITQFNNYVARTRGDLNILFTGATLGTNGAYRLMLDIPLFQYIGYDIGVAGPHEIMVSFKGKAKYDFGNATQPAVGSPMLIALENDVSLAY